MTERTICYPNPTPQQEEQAAVAQADVLDVMTRLVRDGFDFRAVLAGASSATASMVNDLVGAAEVPRHFAVMSALTMHLAAGGEAKAN